jgi:hypothetical protein
LSSVVSASVRAVSRSRASNPSMFVLSTRIAIAAPETTETVTIQRVNASVSSAVMSATTTA